MFSKCPCPKRNLQPSRLGPPPVSELEERYKKLRPAPSPAPEPWVALARLAQLARLAHVYGDVRRSLLRSGSRFFFVPQSPLPFCVSPEPLQSIDSFLRRRDVRVCYLASFLARLFDALPCLTDYVLALFVAGCTASLFACW